MACIFPGAANPKKYWQNIVSKVDSVGEPTERWGAEKFYDPLATSNDRIYCKRGGYLKELAEFNPLEHGVTPSSIQGAEPGHFLALRAAHEALVDAGYFETPVDGARVEVILGKGAQFGPADVNAIQHGIVVDQTLRILKQLHPEHTEAELETIKRELKAGLAPFNAETVPGLVSSIVTGRINNRLDFMGTNYTVDAACASSLIAVERGVQDLLSGRCDLALVGGIEPCIPPLMLMVFCQINALSRKGRIRPFDKDAAGTLLGEGVGIVVLKRKRDAERDGDRIYALIKGVGVASDGRAVGLLAPRLEGEVLALERAYDEAAVDPTTIGLIEAHGTGVLLGDVTEVQALSRVFGSRRGSRPACALGSVKSMISHLVHAAGVAGLIKAALALHHKTLPPTLHCEEPHSDLELEQTPFYLNTETRPWIHGGDHPRRAGVSAFGFGGINAHAVLEEYIAAGTEEPAGLSRQWETEALILQGESRQDLIDSCRRLLDFLSGRPEVELLDVAYSLNCPLRESAYRLSIVAESLTDLEKKLESSLERLADPACERINYPSGIFFFERPLGREGSLAFMFPGYGSEYVNMLVDLCLYFPEIRARFDNLDKVAMRGGREILPSQILFPAPLTYRGEDASSERDFSEMSLVSSAMCTGALAMLDLLTRLEIKPDAVVGHSNGEFAALLAAGAIALRNEEELLEHALRAQGAFDSFADLIPAAKVLTIGGGDRDVVDSLLQRSGGKLQLTIDNCPNQSVICGPEDAIAAASAYLQGRGVICSLLPFDHAVHSSLFQPICDQIAAVHQGLEFLPPRIAAYSCATAQPHSHDPEQIRRLVMNHLARPVRFRETIEAMYQDGARIFVEVGPKASLTGFVNDILTNRRYAAVPSNLSTRSGVTQLNHLIGLLAAHQIPMHLDYLYARRSPNALSFNTRDELSEKRARTSANKAYSMRLSLEYPLLELKGERNGKPPAAIDHPINKERTPIGKARFADSPGARATVMNEYLQTMEQFLETGQVVFERLLATAGSTASLSHGFHAKQPTVTAARSGPAFSPGPFNLTIRSMTEGQAISAVCRFDLEEDLFLRDHTVGRSPSVLDQTLLALPVIPLTITMELMARAASFLVPGLRLVGMRNLRSHRWIEVGESGQAVSIAAKVKRSASTVEMEVRVFDESVSDERRSLFAEGVMVFGSEYQAAPSAASHGFRRQRPYHLRPERYYDSMFHGPSFQSVASIDQFDQSAMEATLKKPPASRLFRSSVQPDFLTDPVLLDGAGQVIGFWTWTLERFEEGAATFPVGFEALDIYRPFKDGDEPVRCLARISASADSRTHSDIDLVGPGGDLLARVTGWENLRLLGWTHLFNQFILSPRSVVYSAPCSKPISHLPEPWGIERREVSDGPGEFWLQVLAAMALSRRERDFFARISPEQGRRQWLLGRLAAKDAARVFIERRRRLELCPADIEIETIGPERFSLAPHLVEKTGCDLLISVSHSPGRAIAIAGPPESRLGVNA